MLLIQFGIRERSRAPRVRAIVEAVIADGNLVLAPHILRKHLLANGMTRHRQGQQAHLVFGESETRELFDRELPRYRAALLDGTLLKRVPNVEALFVINNMLQWDDRSGRAC